MKHKGRYILGFLIVVSILLVSFKKLPSEAIPITYVEYTVQPGDTLWSIASKYPHNDVQSLIYDIERASDTSALIRVGQELRIPIEKK